MQIVIGINGGGTHTSCAFYGRKGENEPLLPLHSEPLVGDSTNPAAIGFETMYARLERLLLQGLWRLNISGSRVVALCAGISGIVADPDGQSAQRQLSLIGKRLGFSPDTVYLAMTDRRIALRGALGRNETTGILVISGTGSSALGQANGKQFESGGWGHVLGDGGSGYDIGLSAIKAVCDAHDLMLPRTALHNAVLKALGLTQERHLIALMHNSAPSKADVADLAKLVFAAAEQSDPIASCILNRAAARLVDLVRSLHRKCGEFGEHTPIYASGSILAHANEVSRQFAAEVHENKLGLLTSPAGSPLDGAAALALESVYQLQTQQTDGDNL